MNRFAKSIGIYFLIFALVLSIAWMYGGDKEETYKEISFSQLVNYLAEEQVKTIEISDVQESDIKPAKGELKSGMKFTTNIPTVQELKIIDEKYIIPQLEAGVIKDYSSAPPKVTPWYLSMLPTLLLIVLMVVFFVMITNQQGGGKAMQFGKSRARMTKAGDLKKVTFKDVAGLDEEKEELQEIVDFLKNPRKYKSLGARIPKGVLLVGPPGTGKTYISKATAGEAGVPFFSISGSDFVEMFVGVGASRVRDLFTEAKKNSPCIIFIDEIDAVGRKRGAGIGGGHDEREQTLNQMLVEMDGFAENTGIIILAATNRPDILDPALLRPGRFDRQITIGIPDIKAREEIFAIHARNKPLDETVNPKILARRTPGFTPADIENLLNEAALLTARRNGMKIRMDEVEEAITKVIAGPEKKSRVISEKERKLTAFHEAGHAVIARLLPNSDPVHQITIIPRGRAGGFTMILPKEDRQYGTKTDMGEQIIHLLGGRVAEKLVLGEISTGASNDIMRATEIARVMVTKYGFSDRLGPINYSSTDEVFLGNDYHTRKNYSEEVAREIDEEIKAIITKAFDTAEKLLSENLDKLTVVAESLLEIETLDGEQFEALFTGELTKETLLEKYEKQNSVRRALDKQEAEERAEIEKIEMEQERKRKEMEEALQAQEERIAGGKQPETLNLEDMIPFKMPGTKATNKRGNATVRRLGEQDGATSPKAEEEKPDNVETEHEEQDKK